MKNLALIFSILLMAATIACQQNDEPVIEETGEVTFGYNVTETDFGGRKGDWGRTENAIPTKILVTILNAVNGDTLYNRTSLDINPLSGFVSQPIALLVGDYELVEFLVQDDAGNDLYATPVENSVLAYLVEDPLPIDFSVTKDGTEQITPDVISTEDVSAADFGYSDFNFNIVETFDFLISVFYFDGNLQANELTTASLTVRGDGELLYDDALAAITNQVRIEDVFFNYEVTVTKADFVSQTITYSQAQMKAFLNSPVLFIMAPEVTTYEVFANGNSTTGGTGLAAGSYQAGDSLRIFAAASDTWNHSESLESNADGHVTHETDLNGVIFPTGALVGSLDGGTTFFKIGIYYETTFAAAANLTLYSWDSDSDNNDGSITVSIQTLE